MRAGTLPAAPARDARFRALHGEKADGLPEAQVRTWVARYREKYHWEMPERAEGVYRVTPTRVLAWISDSSGLDAGAQFSNSATEWRFG